MEDRVCTKFASVSSAMCCGRLHCILCFNWHKKWVHGAQFAYDCEKGEFIETNYTFYPPPDVAAPAIGYHDELSGLSDEQLLQLEEVLRLKITQ